MAQQSDSHTPASLATTVVVPTRAPVKPLTEEEHRKRYKTREVATIATDSPCVAILRDAYRFGVNPYHYPSYTRELNVRVPELGAIIVSASRSRLVASWLEVKAMIIPRQGEDEELAPRFVYYTIRLTTLKVYEADD